MTTGTVRVGIINKVFEYIADAQKTEPDGISHAVLIKWIAYTFKTTYTESLVLLDMILEKRAIVVHKVGRTKRYIAPVGNRNSKNIDIEAIREWRFLDLDIEETAEDVEDFTATDSV